MNALKSLRDKLLQFHDFWFDIKEKNRHIILFAFPMLLALIATFAGSLVDRFMIEGLGRYIGAVWFILWCFVLYAFVFLFAILMDERRKSEENACTDYLTGVFTRRHTFERGMALTERAGWDEKIICVCFIDIDNMKAINDGHGHASGDAALKEIGRRLAGIMRKQIDVVGRYGGDEFVVIWTTEDKNSINETFRRIVECLDGAYILHDGEQVDVRASAGLSNRLIRPDDDPEKELTSLIRQADAVLKNTKNYKADN